MCSNMRPVISVLCIGSNSEAMVISEIHLLGSKMCTFIEREREVYLSSHWQLVRLTTVPVSTVAYTSVMARLA